MIGSGWPFLWDRKTDLIVRLRLVSVVLLTIVLLLTTGVANGASSEVCVNVGTHDSENKGHPTTLLLEQLDGDFADIAETTDDSNPDGCMREELDDYYIYKAPPGEYLVHVRNDQSRVNERWGIFERTVGGEEETFALSRSAPYHTRISFESPRDSRRFEPDETAQFEARLYNGHKSKWRDVTTEVYVYPAGSDRPGQPTKRLSTVNISPGRQGTVTGTVEMPDTEGEYVVDVEFVTDFGSGQFTSDYVDLGTVMIDTFEPPTIDDSSPEEGSVKLGPQEQRTFSVTASDQNSETTTTEWYVDGSRIGNGDSYDFNAEEYDSGEHTIRAVVSDGSDLTDDATISWTVDIAEPPEINSVTPGNEEVKPGNPVTFDIDTESTGLDYEWRIDGERFTGSSVERTFVSTGDKEVQVAVTNDRGVTATRSFVVTVVGVSPSITNLSLPSSTVEAGEKVSLSADAVDSADRDVAFDYEWAVDGETLSGRSVSTTLRTVGTHDVKLTVTNEYGASSTTVRSISVTNDEPSIRRLSPSSGADVSPPTGTSMRFVANVTDRDAANGTVVWSVDGEEVETDTVAGTSRQVAFSHAFDNQGTHSVTARIEDGRGARESVDWSVSVANRDPSIESWTPDASSISPLTGNVTTFSVNATDPEKAGISYRWFVDGSEIASGETLQHTFDKAGRYNVTAIAVDGHGGTARHSWTVEARNFRKAPAVDATVTARRLDPNGTIELASVSLRNPQVNSRSARVEIALDLPDGIGVSRTNDIDEGDASGYVGYARSDPGDQVSSSISLSVRDDSLDGQRIEIPYQVIYYPEGQRDSYQVVDNTTLRLAVGDVPLTEGSDGLGPTGGNGPGFGITTSVVAVIGVIIVRHRSGWP